MVRGRNTGTLIFSLVLLGAAPFLLFPSVQPGGRGQRHPFLEGVQKASPTLIPTQTRGPRLHLPRRTEAGAVRFHPRGLACDSCQSFISLEHV